MVLTFNLIQLGHNRVYVAVALFAAFLYYLNRWYTKFMFYNNMQTYFVRNNFHFIPISGGTVAASTSMAQLHEMPPISGITFYKGSYANSDKLKDFVRKRSDEILAANPWLMGKLLIVNNILLLTFPSANYENFTFLSEIESKQIKSDMSYTSLVSKLGPILVQRGSDVVDTCSSLFKVTVVTMDEGSFALVVSMNPVLGDVATFYNVCNMFNAVSVQAGESNVKTLVYRPPQYLNNKTMTETAAAATTAKGSVPKVPSPISNHNHVNIVPVAAVGFFATYFNMLYTFLAIRGAKEPSLVRVYELDDKALSQQKSKAFSEKEAIVLPVSRVSNTSSEEVTFPDPNIIKYISSNDILSAWFFSLSKCAHGMLSASGVYDAESHKPENDTNLETELKEKSTAPEFGGSEFRLLHFRGCDSYKHAVLLRLAVNRSLRTSTFVNDSKDSSDVIMAAPMKSKALFSNWIKAHRGVDFDSCITEHHLPILRMDTSDAVACGAVGVTFRHTHNSKGIILMCAEPFSSINEMSLHNQELLGKRLAF